MAASCHESDAGFVAHVCVCAVTDPLDRLSSLSSPPPAMSNAYVALEGCNAPNAPLAPSNPQPPQQYAGSPQQQQQQQQYFNPQAYGAQANYQQGAPQGGFAPQQVGFNGMPSLPVCGICGAVARDRCTYGIRRGNQCQTLLCMMHSTGVPGMNGGIFPHCPMHAQQIRDGACCLCTVQ